MRILKESFSCQRDGLTIRGTQYRPADGHDLPAAIVCHGFMANQGTVRRYARFLAGKGYAAFCFDFCGGCVIGGRSDGATTDMSVLTEISDLEAVMDHVSGLPHVRSGRSLLMGCSQGGFVAALTAARHPGRVQQLILLYPALCMPDDARAGKMMWARFDPADVPERLSCGPMKLGRRYVTDVTGMHPPAELTPYAGDVLILHGGRDRIVAPAYSEEAMAAYRLARQERQGTNRLMHRQIPGAGHGFSGRADRLALQHISDFLTP